MVGIIRRHSRRRPGGRAVARGAETGIRAAGRARAAIRDYENLPPAEIFRAQLPAAAGKVWRVCRSTLENAPIHDRNYR